MSALTAAEKAEKRRQKILAKKNLRMAYVNGDTSQFPSKTDVALEANGMEVAPSHDGTGVNTDPCTSTVQTTMRATPADAEHYRTENLFGPPASVSTTQVSWPTERAFDRRWEISPNIRMMCFVALAIALPFASHMRLLNGWPISSIELFIYANLVMGMPKLVRFALSDRAVSREQTSLGSISTILNALSWLPIAFTKGGRMIREFSVYLMTFLCTWYIISYTSS